jgi:hypothetical protein
VLNAKDKKIFKLRKRVGEDVLICSDGCNADFVISLDGVVECSGCGDIKGLLTRPLDND